MAVTITKERGAGRPNAGVLETPCTLTPDTSYPSGGYSLSASSFGQRSIQEVKIIGSNTKGSRYKAFYDTQTSKLRIFQVAGPSLVVEEAVTVTSHAATLDRVPGYILAVHVTAGSVTGAFRVIPVGKTPTTGQVAVNLLTGAMAFLAADAVTACKVTYIPLGVGPFVEANRVVDESITLASAGGNLAVRAGLIQYVWNNTASAGNRLPAIQPVGEAPGSNQCAIDIENSTATTITVNAGQNGNAGLVTYWKHAPLVQYGWTNQADIAVTSNAVVFGEVLDLSGIFIPGFGQVIVGETGASANLQAVMIGPSGSTATNVAVYDPAKNTLSLASGDSYGTIEMPYIVLDAAMLGAGGIVEVDTGRDLSALTFKALVVTK